MFGLFNWRSRATWKADMWYRFVVYREGHAFVSLEIDVMADGPDVVANPSERAWQDTAPRFVRTRREAVLQRLKSVAWNREVVWEESEYATCLSHDPKVGPLVQGCIEATPGGRYLEEQQFFQPGSPLSFAEARQVWTEAERKLAAQASGTVRLAVANAKPNSMFLLVSLPALKQNPNVTLDFVDERSTT